MTEATKTANPLDAIESTDFLARYRALCKIRDQVNAKNAPLEAELEKANLAVAEAQAKAAVISAQIDANRGGEKWIALKREIRILAAGLGSIPREEAPPANAG